MLENCKEKKAHALAISLCAKRRQPAGVGILPCKVIGDSIKNIINLSKEEGFPSFSDRICLVYRADVQKAAAAKELVSLVRTSLRKAYTHPS